jgi:hypothetical protein
VRREIFLLSVDGTFPNRSRSGDSFALGQKRKRRSTSSKKMPHVSQFVHKMSRGRGTSKNKKVVSRNRSDLSIDEFGANTRYKDDSLSGQAMSPHWNKEGKV